MTHARTFRDLWPAICSRAYSVAIPTVPLHRGREYHNAASHSCVQGFRTRMELYKRQVQHGAR